MRSENSERPEDEMRPEYDAALRKGLLQNGIRDKSMERDRQETCAVDLASNVAVQPSDGDGTMTIGGI